MKKNYDFDVVIVGAGPGGCLAARDLARAKLSVGLFDASAREKLSKRIVLEIERAMFATTDVPPPAPDEIAYTTKTMRILTTTRKSACVVREPIQSHAVFFEKFTKRLLRYAEDAGAKFFDGRKAVRPLIDGRRVLGVEFRSGKDSDEVRARLVIDATGFDAALVRALPPETGMRFIDDSNDVVIAANALHAIDEERARQAVSKGLHGDEETWTQLGLHGSYSTEFSNLSIAGGRGYVLLGRKLIYGDPTPETLINEHKTRLGYYGKKLYGGRGLIRIAHPLDRLVADGFMAIGEAGCQVIPIHGSGVASAMYAGKLAAQAAAQALAAGESTAASLWPYARNFYLTRGALLAAYDVSRRVTEKFEAKRIDALLESGVMNEEDFLDAAVPRLPSPSPASVLKRAAGLAKKPGLIPPIAKLGYITALVHAHYKAYPAKYDEEKIRAWSDKTARLFGQI